MFRLLVSVFWIVIIVVGCFAGERGESTKSVDQHPIKWDRFATLCDLVVIYKDPCNKIEGRYSSDPEAIATIVDWLKLNWNKLPTSAGVVMPAYWIKLVLPNLVTLDLPVFPVVDSSGKRAFEEHELVPIVQFLESPNTNIIVMPLGIYDTGRVTVMTNMDDPFNWEAIEDCSCVLVWENGKRDGKSDYKDRRSKTWRDPQISTKMVSWLRSNWNKLPLRDELGVVAPSYKVSLSFPNAVSVDFDVYTVFDVSSVKRVYEEHDLDVFVEFLRSTKNHKTMMTTGKSFGSSRWFPIVP